MKYAQLKPLLIATTMLVLASCSTTRYVPDGQYLLNAVKLKAETSATASEDSLRNAPLATLGTLRNYVRQNPNARWFSAFKLPLATYSLSGRDTTRWLNRTLRNLGEPPVLFDSLKAALTVADLRQQLCNEGFLNADARMELRPHGKKVDVTYWLRPGEPYFIHHINYQIADSVIREMLFQTPSLISLKEGMRFNVARLDDERKRITTFLTSNGYFRFHKEYITYQADTLAGTRLIDLTLRLAAPRAATDGEAAGTGSTLHQRFSIRNITYANSDPQDTRLHLRHHVLDECTHLYEGGLYSAAALQDTYNHFGRLQAVKYTNITFRPVDAVPDSSALGIPLDCDIQVLTNKPSTLSFQPEGTNTAGDLGAAASLTYQNRNLFRCSEVLSIELRGAYEAIRGLEGYSNQDFVEYSVESRLQYPRLIAPFVSRQLRQRLNATSQVSLLYDLQNRPEFHRRLLSAVWRYRWSPSAPTTRHQTFTLDVLDLNYVFMPWISSTFHKEYLESESNRNAILRYNYEDLFITKIGFGFSHATDNFALKTNIETSGNILSLGAKALRASKDERGHYRLFNIAFAQYVKGDIDLTRSFTIDRNNQLVLHFALGIAYPYGNSTVLPFEKRYFSGGANSVRGWSVRSLGPGKYKEHDGRINFINQTGDMKLDLNAEYRSKLFWKFSGAAFIDAGNIWTLRAYDEQPGGQFRLKDFPSQLAVSYGLGLRLNFDYFILRFDLGMKAVNPAYEDDDRHFPILHPRFSRDYAFHFAVGMPF